MNRVIQVHTPLGSDVLMFRAMHGHERLSQLYEFEVDMISASHSLDLHALLGQPLTLEMKTQLLGGMGAGKRFLDGKITRCSLVGRDQVGTRNYFVYRATVRPWLWYLTQASDNRIFQGKSVPEVIDEILGDYGLPYEKQFSASYRSWDYCVQYQESDFAFISRLMEHEGIYYWFKHEQGKHTLVLTDDVSHHAPFPNYESIPYFGGQGDPRQEHIEHWEVSEQITPAGFATVDYDFKKPAASLEGVRRNPGGSDYADLEVFEWLGGYCEPEQAEHYSRVRLESLQSQRETVKGRSNARGIAPGYLFTMRNHPRQAENREYLIVGTRYRLREGGYTSGSDAGLFEIDFVVQPSQTPFRPARMTPMPRTHGPQTAQVVGPKGEEIWTDQYGRVKVQFHWDRYGKRDQNSSCWVRVSSPWAGGGFGGIQLPRVNDEVIVDFIGGHPDRPIVIGRVFNAANMPPWELPGSATQSGFISRSKDGTPTNANALRFEDKPGVEQIWLHAERDLLTEVEKDEVHNVDGNRSTTVGGNDQTTIVGNRNIHVQGTDELLIDKTQQQHVVGKVTRIYDAGHDFKITADGEKRQVTGLFDEELKNGQKVVVSGENAEYTVSSGHLTQTVKSHIDVKSESSYIKQVANSYMVMEATDSFMRLQSKGFFRAQSETSSMDLIAATKVKMEAEGSTMDIKAKGKITMKSTGDQVEIQGTTIKEKSSDSNWKVTVTSKEAVKLGKDTVGMFKTDAWVYTTSVQGRKTDITGLKVDIYGVGSKIKGTDLDEKAVAFTQAGLTSSLGILTMFL